MDIVLNNFPQVKEKVAKIVEDMKAQFDKQNSNCFVGFDVQKFDNERKVLLSDTSVSIVQKLFQSLGDFIPNFCSSEGVCIKNRLSVFVRSQTYYFRSR